MLRTVQCMARLTPAQRRRLDFALDAGLPIPADLVDVARRPEPCPTEIAERSEVCLATARNVEELYGCDEYPQLVAAARAWCDAQHGQARPDLVGVSGKESGTILERELRDVVEATMGRVLGGNAGLGTDIPALNVDIKSTLAHNPQGGVRCSSSTELVFGVDHHLLIVGYEIDQPGDVLDVHGVAFVPRWFTADHGGSTFAEQLRRAVVAGEMSTAAALAELAGRGVDATEELIEALESDQPIRQGWLGMSRVDTWRLRYPRVVRPARAADRWVFAVGSPEGPGLDESGLPVGLEVPASARRAGRAAAATPQGCLFDLGS